MNTTPLMHNNIQSPILFAVKDCPVFLVNHATGTQHSVQGSRAIVRMIDKQATKIPHALSVVSSSYKLITNHELFTAIENVMIKEIISSNLKDVQIEDKAAHKGRDAFRQYIFPSVRCDVEEGKPGVAFRVVVQNSYGGGAIKIHAGAIDFFCQNGMVTGAYKAAYAKHTRGITIDRFENVITDALNTFVKYTDVWKKWHQQRVTASEGFEMLKRLAGNDSLSAKLHQQMLGEFEDRGDNLWAVYSAATRWASHYPVVQREDSDSVANVLSKREEAVAAWVASEAKFLMHTPA